MNFIDTKDVLAILKVSRNTLLELINNGDFPQPIVPGKRKRVWREADVLAWVAAQ